MSQVTAAASQAQPVQGDTTCAEGPHQRAFEPRLAQSDEPNP